MTFWVTLWYAGAVVFALGGEGMTMKECEDIGQVIMLDIAASYINQSEEMAKSVFPTHQFEVTCEPKPLPTDEKYAE